MNLTNWKGSFLYLSVTTSVCPKESQKNYSGVTLLSIVGTAKPFHSPSNADFEQKENLSGFLWVAVEN